MQLCYVICVCLEASTEYLFYEHPVRFSLTDLKTGSEQLGENLSRTILWYLRGISKKKGN
jgi:hypothetical protein